MTQQHDVTTDLSDYLAQMAEPIGRRLAQHGNIEQWEWGAKGGRPNQTRVAVVLSRLFDQLARDPDLNAVSTAGIEVRRHRDMNTIDVLVFVERIDLPAAYEDVSDDAAAYADDGDEGVAEQ